jgi:MFS family permease
MNPLIPLSDATASTMQSQTGNAAAYPPFRWFVAATVTFGNIASGAIFIIFAPILGVVAPEFGITLGQAALLLLTTWVFANAIGVIVSGPLIDRFGMRASIILGGSLTVVACLALPHLTGLGPIMAMRVLQGFGLAPVAACGPAMAARWFPPHERGVVIGSQASGIALGIAVSLIATPTALQRYNGNWRPGMLWFTGLSLVALALCLLTLLGKEPEGSHSVDADSAGDFKLAMHQYTFYIGALCLIGYLWILNAFNSLGSAYLAVDAPRGVGLGPMVAGKLMMGVQVGMILGSLVAGILAQKLFKGNVRPMIMIAFLLTGIFMVCIKVPSIHGSLLALPVFLFFAGFCEPFVMTGVALFVALHYPPGIIGKIFSLMLGISLFGGTAGVGIGGAILHETNSFDWPIMMIGFVAAAGIIIAGFLRFPKDRRAPLS